MAVGSLVCLGALQQREQSARHQVWRVAKLYCGQVLSPERVSVGSQAPEPKLEDGAIYRTLRPTAARGAMVQGREPV